MQKEEKKKEGFCEERAREKEQKKTVTHMKHKQMCVQEREREREREGRNCSCKISRKESTEGRERKSNLLSSHTTTFSTLLDTPPREKRKRVPFSYDAVG